MQRKGGLPTPKKALHGAPPPSPFLFAGLDELARDKRLCGRTMKGLLTMLHPPEALPAGHRLPECHSLSRPQSQHASLPFSSHPANPPEPHTDCHVDDHKCCYESNAVSERNAAVCRGRRDWCISPTNAPNRTAWDRTGVGAGCQVRMYNLTQGCSPEGSMIQFPGI